MTISRVFFIFILCFCILGSLNIGEAVENNSFKVHNDSDTNVNIKWKCLCLTENKVDICESDLASDSTKGISEGYSDYNLDFIEVFFPSYSPFKGGIKYTIQIDKRDDPDRIIPVSEIMGRGIKKDCPSLVHTMNPKNQNWDECAIL